MSNSIPPIAVLVQHRVADYEPRKEGFDGHQDKREEASCIGHDVLRAADDPNMVYVYCPGTNPEEFTAFLDSAELRDIMQRLGVEGPPTITLMKPISDDSIQEALPAIIVNHTVEDYSRWRAVYDDFEAHRREQGIVGQAVNQEYGNPNQVIVYHQARDERTLRDFIASDELKQTMQRAGVSSEPEIHFVQMLEFKEY